MKKLSILQNNRGVSIIEVFISISVLMILLTGSLSLIFPAVRSTEIAKQRLQAEGYLWEQEEAVRQVRNETWVDLTPGTYYASYNPTSNPPSIYQGWQLFPGAGVRNGFTVSMVISTPYRVNNQQLSDSSGTIDNAMRKIIYTVSWVSFGTTYSMNLTSYLSDWQPF